jgi:transcriptional regulator NrdR family protein
MKSAINNIFKIKNSNGRSACAKKIKFLEIIKTFLINVLKSISVKKNFPAEKLQSSCKCSMKNQQMKR